jgi:hypothetical protein
MSKSATYTHSAKNISRSLYWILSGVGILIGAASSVAVDIGGPEQGERSYIVCEIGAFLIAIGFLLPQWQTLDFYFWKNIGIIVLFSCICGIASAGSGDSIYVTVDFVIKILLFFVTSHLCVVVSGLGHVLLVWLASFSLGCSTAWIPLGANLSDIAKYMCPPLYVGICVSLALYFVRMELVGLPLVAIGLYGAFFGGSRGSLMGGIALLFFLFFSTNVFLTGIANKLRYFIATITVLGSMILPVSYTVLYLRNSSYYIKYDTEQTKSNIERATMILFGFDRIMDSPLVGAGFERGYDELVDYFSAEFKAFDATTSLHNQLLDFAYYTGLFGFSSATILFIDLVSRVLKNDVLVRERYYADSGILSVPAVFSIFLLMAASPFASSTRVFLMLVIAAATTKRRSY